MSVTAQPDLVERVLRALPAGSVTEIADALHVPRPEVSRALGALVDNGLALHVGPDRDWDWKPLGRRSVGIDCAAEYVEMARRRLEKQTPAFELAGVAL